MRTERIHKFFNKKNWWLIIASIFLLSLCSCSKNKDMRDAIPEEETAVEITETADTIWDTPGLSRETASDVNIQETAEITETTQEAYETMEETDMEKQKLEELAQKLNTSIKGEAGSWSVYLAGPNMDQELIMNESKEKAASLIKIYVMAAVYDAEALDLIYIDKSIESMLQAMITVSDNESTNNLVEVLGDGSFESGMKYVNIYLKENGYSQTYIGRRLGAYENSTEEAENYTSVTDCGRILQEIYLGTCVSEEASEKMLSLLTAQERTEKIPAGLPDGVTTANKTGELPDVESDAAIIFLENADYILCIIAADLTDTSAARQKIVEISELIYNDFSQ